MKNTVYNEDKNINDLGDRIQRNRNTLSKDMDSNAYRR